MPSLETIILVGLAGFALSITPGPSMLYVLSRSIGQSRAAGFASAIGLGMGGVALALAAAFGLAAIFQQSSFAVQFLKTLGAFYLFYLGVGMIWQSSENEERLEIKAIKKLGFLNIVWQSALVELLNPKTILFFALFIPPFVELSGSTNATEVTLQLLILGALVPLTAVPSDIAVAFIGGSLAQTINTNPALRIALSRTGGAILIGIALNLYFDIL